jgi:hypothetical protein
LLRPNNLLETAGAEAACKKLLSTDPVPWRSLEIANRFVTKPACKIGAPTKHPFKQSRHRRGLQETDPDWLAPRAELRNRKPVPNETGLQNNGSDRATPRTKLKQKGFAKNRSRANATHKAKPRNRKPVRNKTVLRNRSSDETPFRTKSKPEGLARN